MSRGQRKRCHLKFSWHVTSAPTGPQRAPHRLVAEGIRHAPQAPAPRPFPNTTRPLSIPTLTFSSAQISSGLQPPQISAGLIEPSSGAYLCTG
ncbi:hypothetical protein AAFF_G00146440 [Aldrovandia affinis]|uniref:Uncharacterized protein n=1 Tax=Aldrovandia affinis TaxID=143900 RepID=A0AAD7W978_9TELE|nr:hypothetical protein AAFF_G00146440 [Aldrovandia affinis]